MLSYPAWQAIKYMCLGLNLRPRILCEDVQARLSLRCTHIREVSNVHAQAS